MPRAKPSSPLGEAVDDFAAQAMEEIERRHDLERRGRLAAEVQIDLGEHGALGVYVAARRKEAVDAMWVFFRQTDPADAVAVAACKADIDGYLRVRDWIIETMKDADDAARTIQEEYGNQHDDRYPDED